MPEPSPAARLVAAFETHDLEEVRAALDAGADASEDFEGRPVTAWLLASYMRSSRLPECLRLLLDAGASLEDADLEPVLLDDPAAIEAAANDNPFWLTSRVSLSSAFTSLRGVTLLHVAAEYGLERAARALVALGVGVDARAGIDEHGRGGHTPLFHTVQQSRDRGADVRRMLLDAGARTDFRVAALAWGEGFEWETTFFDLTPIAYCQMGLLPQVHRDERTTYDVVRELLVAAGRTVPPLENVPNRYVARG